MTRLIFRYFSPALWGTLTPYLLMPLAAYLLGTYFTGLPPDMQPSDIYDFVLNLIRSNFLYYEPFLATFIGWRTQRPRLAFWSAFFFSLLSLSPLF